LMYIVKQDHDFNDHKLRMDRFATEMHIDLEANQAQLTRIANASEQLVNLQEQYLVAAQSNTPEARRHQTAILAEIRKINEAMSSDRKTVPARVQPPVPAQAPKPPATPIKPLIFDDVVRSRD
jgi:hypothetical protein